MKTHIRLLLWLPMLSALLLSACSGEPHFLKEEAYRKQVAQDFEQKRQALPHGDWFNVLDKPELTVAEREALMFLYAYMPISDIADYGGDYYLDNFRLSGQARDEMPWGKTVPDELFRHFVLPIRVNNENLDNAREVFFAELKDRVKGLSMKDAILEVNHWCHEKVVYRPSDARTSSPLATLRTAYGRCGEESTFAVAALRSVGIPARQVYTPRWAHTDDNHAWVEAWADGKWYFLGACEPEPVLNLGWFNAPASRGMLMHTKVFGRYNGPEEVMLETANYTEINVTENYAPTAKAVVTVTDTDGKPVAGAKVDFKVYNYAEFYTVATKYTDASGKASLTAGKGDMLVWASDKGVFGFSKLSFGKQSELALTLDKREGDEFEEDFDIVPPAEDATLPEVTVEQRAENDRRMAQEDSIRNAYVAAAMLTDEQARQIVDSLPLDSNDKRKAMEILVASRGNYKTLVGYLNSDVARKRLPLAFDLLEGLSQKDWRDISPSALSDPLLSGPDTLPKQSWAQLMILKQRIENEGLVPYRAFLKQAVSATDAERFRKEPAALVEWCRKEITIHNDLNSQRIRISPVGVWRTWAADENSLRIFFVAMARTLGIPAEIDPVTGKVFYYDRLEPFAENGVLHKEGRRVEVDFASVSASTESPTGIFKASYTPIRSLDNPKYYSHFTLSKFNGGVFDLLSYDEGSAESEGATWSNLLKNGTKVDAGYYMLTTGTRMASGMVLARIKGFNVKPGAATVEKLIMRESQDQVAVIGNFNSESLFTPVEGVGEKTQMLPSKQSLLQACGRGYFVVGILGPGQEPTNHALRDIAVLSSDLEKWGRKMVLLFPDEAQCRKYHPAEFTGLPSTIIYGIDTDGIGGQIVENMKLKHKGSLPIFIIADTFNRVVFVSQGYTIGLGEQLMKVVHGL